MKTFTLDEDDAGMVIAALRADNDKLLASIERVNKPDPTGAMRDVVNIALGCYEKRKRLITRIESKFI